jgi:hypothetical protein
MDRQTDVTPPPCALFQHYLYEYSKGVRHLFMMTLSRPEAEMMQDRLDQAEVTFHLQDAGPRKVNLFFGRTACVETVRTIATKPLSHLTPQEDFILGTLLGYDREQQCNRYLSMTRNGGRPAAQPWPDRATA